MTLNQKILDVMIKDQPKKGRFSYGWVLSQINDPEIKTALDELVKGGSLIFKNNAYEVPEAIYASKNRKKG